MDKINNNSFQNRNLDVIKTSKSAINKKDEQVDSLDNKKDSVSISYLSLCLAKLNGIPEIREVKIKEALDRIKKEKLLEPPSLKNGILRMLTYLNKESPLE